MAIALETSTTGDPIAGSVNGGSGSGRTIIFMTFTDSGSDSVTAVTWNGESFTKVGSRQSGAARYATMWYLIPSGTGTQTLSITGGQCCNTTFLVYSGTDQAAPKNFNSAAGSTSGAVSVSVTANNGDWLVGAGISNVGTVTESTNTTLRSGSGSNIQVDSNGVASPTALNFSLGSSGSYALIGVAIAPSASSGPTNLKSLDTNVKSNIKSYNTNVIANIKSINTNA